MIDWSPARAVLCLFGLAVVNSAPLRDDESRPLFAGDEVASTVGSLSTFFGILSSQAGNDNTDWDFMISLLPKPLREGFLAGVFSADLLPIAFFWPLGSTISS